MVFMLRWTTKQIPASVKERRYAWLVMTDDKIQSQVVCGATELTVDSIIAAQEGHGIC